MSRENSTNKCSDYENIRYDQSFLYLKKIPLLVQSVMQYLKQLFIPSHIFLIVLLP